MRIAAVICLGEAGAPRGAGDGGAALTDLGRLRVQAAREWLEGLEPAIVLCEDAAAASAAAPIAAAGVAATVVERRLVTAAALPDAIPPQGNVLIVARPATGARLIGDALDPDPRRPVAIPQDDGSVSLLALDDSRDQVLAVNATPLDPLRHAGDSGAPDSAGPPRQRLVLMRHAESQTVTEDGRLRSGGDVPLTERGRRTARALAPYLAPLGLVRVHCSEQLRARQTARGAGGDNVEVLSHAALREISVGDGEGRDAATAFAAAPGFLRDPDVAMPGGETPRQVRERAGRELDRILAEEADAPAVAIVGHGNMNRMLLSHLLGLPLARALRIRQDWAGVNVLERGDGGWTIGTLNWNAGGMREFGLTRRVDGVAPEVWQRLGR